MPVIRSKGKPNASKAREVAIRAGEEKPLPPISSTRDEEQSKNTLSAEPLRQNTMDANNSERVATRPELQRRTTDPQTKGSASTKNLVNDDNAKLPLKHGDYGFKEGRELPSSSSKTPPPTPLKDNNGTMRLPENPTEDSKLPRKEPKPRKVIQLTSQSSRGELRQAIDALQAKIGHQETEHARYLDAINENRSTMQKQSDELRARKSQIQDLQKRLQDQKRRQQSSSQVRDQEIKNQRQEYKIRDLQARLDKTGKDLQALEQHTKQLERAWKESTEEVTKLRQQSSGEKVDDNTLKAGYEEMIYSVNNWAGNYCGSRDATLGESDLSPLELLTPHYARYMSSDVLRPVLMQAFVMKLLVEYVLSYAESDSTGLLWAGRLGPGLRLIEKTLEFGDGFTTQELLLTGKIRESQVQEYSAWKAKSATLVAEQAFEADIDLLVTDMLDHFRNELSPFVAYNKSDPWRDLREIIQMAVKLDKEAHMSRALFTFGKWSGPDAEDFDFEFDEETCVSAHGFGPARKGMNAELIVAPFFMKTGTGDGDKYKESIYLMKCVVVCTETRKMLEKF